MVQRESVAPSAQPGHPFLPHPRAVAAETNPELSATHPSLHAAPRPGPDDRDRITYVGAPPAQAASCDRRLLMRVDGVEGGRVLTLCAAPLSVGRGLDNGLRLEHGAVSRRHAMITWNDGFHLVADLGSRNGTYIRGRRVTLVPLVDGDLLQFGPRACFRYVVTDARQEELMRQLYESSIIDALTGICNRRHFDARLHAELSYARRHGTDLAMVLLDIDFFKAVNDTHGHAAGDAVLKHVSTLARKQLRAEDLIARYGGEEFAILLRGIDVYGGVRLAERVRTTIDAVPASATGKIVPVSVSAGCASLLETGGGSAPELIARADARMYAAKRLGRNRVVGAAHGGL